MLHNPLSILMVCVLLGLPNSQQNDQLDQNTVMALVQSSVFRDDFGLSAKQKADIERELARLQIDTRELRQELGYNAAEANRRAKEIFNRTIESILAQLSGEQVDRIRHYFFQRNIASSTGRLSTYMLLRNRSEDRSGLRLSGLDLDDGQVKQITAFTEANSNELKQIVEEFKELVLRIVKEEETKLDELMNRNQKKLLEELIGEKSDNANFKKPIDLREVVKQFAERKERANFDAKNRGQLFDFLHLSFAEEMELLNDQKSRLKELVDGFRDERRRLWRTIDPKSSEFQEQYGVLVEDTWRQFEKVVLPHQTKRLEQLLLQFSLHRNCYNRRSVLIAHGLNGDGPFEKAFLKRIQVLVEKADNKLELAVKDFQRRVDSFLDSEEQQLKDVLNHKQLAELDRLRGKPFSKTLPIRSLVSIVPPISAYK